MTQKLFFSAILCLVILPAVVFGQNPSMMSASDVRLNNPGVRGGITVSDLSAQGVMREQGIVVVTNKQLTRVLGESVIDQNGIYSISNLPAGQDLLVHYLFRSWCVQTEKVVVSDWVEKNIRVNLNNYNANFLHDELVNYFSLALIGLHYSQIILKGQDLKKKSELIDLIHFLRFKGVWNITGVKRGSNPFTEIAPGRNIELNESFVGKDSNGSEFAWRLEWRKTREKTARHWDKFDLAIVMGADDKFINPIELITTISFENLKYRGVFFEKAKDVYYNVEKKDEVMADGGSPQLEPETPLVLLGSFSFRMNPEEKQVISRMVGNHSIELDFEPIQRSTVNLYFDGIYYDLYNVQHGMGSNSTFLWEPGARILFNDNSHHNSIPVYFDIKIGQLAGNQVPVEVKVFKNPSYRYTFNINEYLGEYYAPHSGDGYTFYMRGGELFVRSTMRDSPYFMSGKLEKEGYRTYTRTWTSAMGISSATFTFNTRPGGSVVINVIGDLVDYPSQGYFLYKR